jgi:NADPH:quinone reductase-like Zn-dependent oxidoreductase
MRALTAERYGAPSDLRLTEVAQPEARAGEILVRIEVTPVGRTDTATLRAHPFFARMATGLLKPSFPIYGLEFAGTVAAVGPGVTRFATGARVFGLSPERFGAHAEFISVPVDGPVATIPDHVPTHEAVICEGAWYASGTTDALQPGHTCLIYGASGAIGTAAVQLAKIQGAHVTAVVGPTHLDLARSLGADAVVDYTTGAAERIDTAFDLIFDAVGHTSYFAWRRRLKPNGLYRATDLGPWWSNIWLGGWSALTRSKRVSVPFPVDPAGFLTRLRDLMQQGLIRGVFDRSYAFDDIADAYAYVDRGQKTGIVTVSVAQDG